ncbi:hypothetical protein GX48_02124 [Paracoccidioides brasiliensis]|nr:hypothetical protein GX48_02124 [Paracoccidioides brasiliensis]
MNKNVCLGNWWIKDISFSISNFDSRIFDEIELFRRQIVAGGLTTQVDKRSSSRLRSVNLNCKQRKIKGSQSHEIVRQIASTSILEQQFAGKGIKRKTSDLSEATAELIETPSNSGKHRENQQ